MIQDWKQEYLQQWCIEKELVLQCKSSDTAIILGSGPSINKCTNEFWYFCAQHDTIAINWWIYHSFVPKFWFIELGYDQKKEMKIWSTLLQAKQHLYKDIIWFHSIDKWLGQVSETEFESIFPKDLKMYFYYRVLYKQWFQNVKKIFSDCKRHQSIDRCFTPSSNLSSVLCALTFAYIMGYQTIILAGVDLGMSTYYWTDYDIPIHRKTCYGNNMDYAHEKHLSEVDYHISFDLAQGDIGVKPYFPTSRILTTINTQILQPQNIHLFVTSKQSMLYPAVQYFDIDKE